MEEREEEREWLVEGVALMVDIVPISRVLFYRIIYVYIYNLLNSKLLNLQFTIRYIKYGTVGL